MSHQLGNVPQSAASSDDEFDDNPDDWQDVEKDEVAEIFVSLFDDEKFENIDSMFNHCKAKYQFDIWNLQRQHDLDFLGLVKLVNYIRRSVSQGNMTPNVSTKSLFDDDLYLLPVMESDPVLYNLEDVLAQTRSAGKSRVEELEEELEALQARFNAYRKDVGTYLGEKFQAFSLSEDQDIEVSSLALKDSIKVDDTDYFHSYSFNAIHETMLKDKIRTDAYRDFIYDNKHIFRDKTVLDVGCGTGILSMFCAKAGAKRVIAVDNSDIIYTAREIVKANGLDDRVQCIRGKIEEVELPVQSVDIIVSEWMGYALLYESMLDSVIRARDKYLRPDGLMVPSHASLKIGLIADSELRETSIDFWQDVYGFDMAPMARRAQEECFIKTAAPEEISGEAVTFKVLDLRKVTVEDLDFDAPFEITAGTGSGRLDGFAIWFDIFFNKQSDALDDNLVLDAVSRRGIVTFSTGPFGPSTHWQQGICFSETPQTIAENKLIAGKIVFDKNREDSRALNISISWQIDESQSRKQTWHIK